MLIGFPRWGLGALSALGMKLPASVSHVRRAINKRQPSLMVCQNARNNIAPMVLHGIDQSRICLGWEKSILLGGRERRGVSCISVTATARWLANWQHIWNGVKEIKPKRLGVLMLNNDDKLISWMPQRATHRLHPASIHVYSVRVLRRQRKRQSVGY